MTGNTEQGDRGKLGKSVLPAMLTLLAGVGGGIFAMQSDDVPGEPLAGDLNAPADTVATPRTAESVALVVPNFTPDAAISTPDLPSTKTTIPAAIAASGVEPGLTVAAFDLTPNPPGAGPLATADSLAASGIVELPQIEQPPAIAAPAAPVVAVLAVPVVQPVNDSPGDLPETVPVSPPAAAVLADNAAALIEQLAPAASTTTASTPVAPAPAATVAAPEAAPAPQLAIADWSYSLPDQASASDVNAFAGGLSSAPLALVPSRATPSPARQRTTARTSGARADIGAHLAAPTRKVATGVGSRKIAGAGFASSLHGKGKYQLVGSDIEFQLPVLANGTPVGNLTLHVAPDQQVSLRLRELLALFHDQIDPQVLTTLVASPSIESFVTFEKLRDAGIDIRYDAARDRLALSVEQP